MNSGKKMERLVFFGKGGIGKSTASTNISACMAMKRDLRVFHVGCDPKHDSTVALMDGEMIPAVVDREYPQVITPEDVISVSKTGVHCAEAGGPHAGVGCAGRGISRTMEVFNKANLLDGNRYDVTVFDILGDVVCGGFAAPLRKDIGEKVIIIASEEVMALYAANNIAKAVVNYASNGIVLAGIIVNRRDNEADLTPVHRFAELIGTRIIGEIPRHPIIREAEYHRMTAVQFAPDSDIAEIYAKLADELIAIDPADCPLPTPLSDYEFYAYTRHKFEEPEGGIGPDPTLTQKKIDEERASRKKAERMASSQTSDAKAKMLEQKEVSRQKKEKYRQDLKAGILAVRLGHIRAEDAVLRLKSAYPDHARSLRVVDLVT